jgi:basic membrane lipoprotein Med (substrate-binding protein (PBP1-ABC) superfamily)
VPREPAGAGPDDPLVHYASAGFRASSGSWGHESETIVIADDSAGLGASAIFEEHFDLVVVAGDGRTARSLVPHVREADSTRFVFVDARLADLGLVGVPNATAFPFADHESAQLIGYLAGIIAPRGGPPRARAKIVSIVVGERTPHAERVVNGFRKGVGRALPDARIRVDYAVRGGTRTECERIANRQIAAGSDAVLALGRPCSQAALAVARTHGVWGLGASDDGVQRGPHVLATTYKYWEGVVMRALNDFELGTLVAGRDVEMGLADDYAVGLDVSDANVPESIWTRVVQLCSRIRQHTIDDAA